MMRIFAGILVVFACVLIAMGRSRIRLARRNAARKLPRGRLRTTGWFLVAMGVFLMMVGVVLW